MNITGTVVSVELGIEIQKQAGGVYQGSRLTYRDVAGSIKEQCFTAQTLKYSPAIKVALGNLSAGEQFNMVKEKEGEFWNVKSLTAGVQQEVALASQVIAGNAAAKSFASPKSTYETPEERAKKQVYIIRQSSITAALNMLGTKAKTVADVTSIAKQFEDYVMGRDSFEDIESDNMTTEADEEID